ncbi:CpaF/VirB11 family protein, partial [Clostridioides difficile]|nr:CpaF/VirB11 family protein [Clostridioides difficile]
VEDSIELHPNLTHHVRYLTNATKGVTAQLVVPHTLRARPDRLIVGETRGAETFDLIRAFNSGHDGSLSTV